MALPVARPLLVIRTSDRGTFRRCRRLWGWTSHLRMGLQLRESADYFWFGSGLHYAMEDYHGVNAYGHPAKAFLAYVHGTRVIGTAPATWDDLLPIGLGILSYYADHWLVGKDPYNTFTIHGEPQVEVNGYIDLGLEWKGYQVVYGFTLDRVIVDEDGRLWIVEYKSAKKFETYHYDTDEQVTAYSWCGRKLYGLPIAGVIYTQFKKTVPEMPRLLAKGGFSTDSRQQTTSSLYRKALLDVYGDLSHIPVRNIQFLNQLSAEESEDGDKFIRRDIIERNDTQLDNFEKRVGLEIEEMLREDLPLYPNPTRDCSWQCPLQAACTALEDGSDYEQALLAYTTTQDMRAKESTWRKHLPNPQGLSLPPEAELYQALMQEASQVQPLAEERVTPEEAFLQEQS